MRWRNYCLTTLTVESKYNSAVRRIILPVSPAITSIIKFQFNAILPSKHQLFSQMSVWQLYPNQLYRQLYPRQLYPLLSFLSEWLYRFSVYKYLELPSCILKLTLQSGFSRTCLFDHVKIDSVMFTFMDCTLYEAFSPKLPEEYDWFGL